MSTAIACNRDDLIRKLLELNFYGPVKMAGNEFMLYCGHALAVPSAGNLTIPQFRCLLREVQSIVSKEEWQN